MAASTYIKFSGLYHLAYETVSACIGGLDCGDYAVDATGSIFVSFGSDDGGLMTPAYLAGLSPFTGENAASVSFDTGNGSGVLTYTVPVVIGAGYTSQGQVLRPATAEDLHSPTGPALGKARRVHQFAALLHNCVKVSFGTDFAATLQPCTFRSVYTDPTTVMAETAMYSGVYRNDVVSSSDFDNMLSWQVNRPLPATVSAVTSFLEGQEP